MAPFLSMGQETYKISIDALFGANRRKVIEKLRQTGHSNSVLYVAGGPAVTRFDSDHEPIFRQESYFWYLSGVKEPDCSIAVDLKTARTVLFIPRLPAGYATIMGRIKTCAEIQKAYGVDEVKYAEDLTDCLDGMLKQNAMNGTATNGSSSSVPDLRPKLLLLKGQNSDSGNWYEPPSPILRNDKLSKYIIDTEALFPVLAECRVTKSEAELSLIRHATEITSFAHSYVMRNIKPGMMEYQGESLFRHYCYFNYGCRLVGYTPICGCGPSAAVLHYGHAGEPNARQTVAGDMCLFDMGAEYHCYGSDVTCSFPVTGKFSEKQLPIYEAVLKAQVAVYDMMRPGVSWVDCHKAAEAAILKSLIELGMVLPLDKSVEELVEMRLGAVFMPHGLGHLIGIDTHDVGGYLPGHPSRIQQPGLKSLRTARVLQENMVLTVEPGCYFIDHLLDGALATDSSLRKHLNAEVLSYYRDFGGVRLEDVVVVTDEGCINYTLCPRTVAEVESVMAGGKWPPIKDEAPELRRLRLTDPTPLPSPPSL